MKLKTEPQCLKIRLKEGTTEKVRQWCETFRRHPELDDVLKRESVIVETLLLDEGEGGDYLIFYLKAESLQQANDFLTNERHPVNDLSNRFMAECWDMSDVKVLEPVLDLHRIGEPA